MARTKQRLNNAKRSRPARYAGKRWEVKRVRGGYAWLERWAGGKPYGQWVPVQCVKASKLAMRGGDDDEA